MAVTPATIAVALGLPAPAEDTTEWDQWSLWIQDARMLIEARLGNLTLLDQAKLDYVVREAVVAQVRRPDDATSVDVAIDDGRVSRTYRSSAGRVTIRDEWWALLKPGTVAGAAFSIIPGGRTGLHLPWCSLMFGGSTCSCGVDIAGYPIYELP